MPGERPPQPASGAGHLERPPSDRYRTAARPAGAADRSSSAAPSIAVAAVVAVAGALLLTTLLGVILVTTGTFVVSLLAGGLIGLIVAGPTVGGAGGSPAMSRSAANRLAIGLALGMVVLAGLATWILARSEGGVMDPISYLWTVFGLGIPAQAVIAVLAAAWGAANGPIRWRQ